MDHDMNHNYETYDAYVLFGFFFESGHDCREPTPCCFNVGILGCTAPREQLLWERCA